MTLSDGIYDDHPYFVTMTDSYRFSHYDQYPKDMVKMHSYMESRGGLYKDIVFFGLQYYLTRLEGSKGLPAWELNELEKLTKEHGVPFNKQGWEYINKLGYLPVEIKAVAEGSINKPFDTLLTIESTDEKVPWVANYLETMLMKLWYPITVASKAYEVKKRLIKLYQEAGEDLDGIGFSYHNFGDRGSSSNESAALGGLSHLTQFQGTDNFNSIPFGRVYYGSSVTGYSIPATEHSTVTSWGKTKETLMLDHYLESNKVNSLTGIGKPIVACVLDSYDIYQAVDYITKGEFKAKVESNDYPIFVIRPDSGNPIDVLYKILSIMMQNTVAYTTNHLGLVKFNKYRIIWGDGVTPETIEAILKFAMAEGFSPANFAFGSGGDLMQNVNRDTCKMAIKCSAILTKDDMWHDVYKDPITDQGKRSKAGRQYNDNLQLVFRNGEIKRKFSFDEVRQNSSTL